LLRTVEQSSAPSSSPPQRRARPGHVIINLRACSLFVSCSLGDCRRVAQRRARPGAGAE
jgi:hypothetical protein